MCTNSRNSYQLISRPRRFRTQTHRSSAHRRTRCKPRRRERGANERFPPLSSGPDVSAGDRGLEQGAFASTGRERRCRVRLGEGNGQGARASNRGRPLSSTRRSRRRALPIGCTTDPVARPRPVGASRGRVAERRGRCSLRIQVPQVARVRGARSCAYAATSSAGSPTSIGFSVGLLLHSNQPPSYTAMRFQSMRYA